MSNCSTKSLIFELTYYQFIKTGAHELKIIKEHKMLS